MALEIEEAPVGRRLVLPRRAPQRLGDNPRLLKEAAAETEAKWKIERENCIRSALYYMEHFVYTQDEHEREDNLKPLLHGRHAVDYHTLQLSRELDGSEDDYLRYITLVWENEALVAVPKSRQLRLTHLMVNLHGWLAQFFPGQKIALQSKKLEDADALLARLDVSLRYQRERWPQMGWLEYKRTHARIVFPNGSIMMAIAQGGDVLRSYTFSAIMADELAFMPEAEEGYTASLPTIEGGHGKFTAISSANPGFFEKLVHDRLGI